MIRYIAHDSIEKDKWDRCIEKSFNRLPFACSWVLDVNSPRWDALVLDDYRAVMPLTWRSRWGVLYICQPTFCQQLGVFSTVHRGPFRIDDFIRAIPKKFKRIELAVNSMNYVSGHFARMKVAKRVNHVLHLDRSYAEVRQRYKESHLKNLEKYNRKSPGLSITEDRFSDFFASKLESFRDKKVRISRLDKLAYFNMLKVLSDQRKLEIYVVKDAANTRLAGVCFAKFDNRLYLHTYCKAGGRKYGLVFFLIDEFIKRKSMQDLVLDFMGSSVPGVKYRNLGFGCEEEGFLQIGIYRFPVMIDHLIRVWRKLAGFLPSAEPVSNDLFSSLFTSKSMVP